MGSYLQKPITQKETHSGKYGGLEFATSCMQGWRTNMEDAHITDPKFDKETQLYAVFDGHGGFEVAEFTAKYFPQQLKNNKNYQNKNFQEALKETFMYMDQLLQTEESKQELINLIKAKKPDLKPEELKSTAGCTANVVLIHKNTIYCANAGDSRCVLSTEGTLVPLSEDHKPENELEHQRVKNAGGEVTAQGRINGNLNLSRAIGDLDYKNNQNLPQDQQLIISLPDVKIHEITHKDEFLIMGCDGIWELKEQEELLQFCRKNIIEKMDLSTICEKSLDLLLAPDTKGGKGCDNMSIILIKLKKNIENTENQQQQQQQLQNDKFKQAGQIANLVFQRITKEKIMQNSSVFEICKFADEEIVRECKKVYLKEKNKGLASPTCISLNNQINYNCPIQDNKQVIKNGDLVKIELGVHIDGFPAYITGTVLCGANQVEGKKAECVHAAYQALQAALRTVQFGFSTSGTSRIIQLCINQYGCTPIQEIKGFEAQKNGQIGGLIYQIVDQECENNSFRYEHQGVYVLDVCVCNGKGQVSVCEESNVYQVLKNKQLSIIGVKKHSQNLWKEIQEKQPFFYFNLRDYQNQQHLEQSIQEFNKQGLLEKKECLQVDQGEFVARFQITVGVNSSGVSFITGGDDVFDIGKFKSGVQVQNEEIKKLLSQEIQQNKKKKNKKK
ncbi:protein phosphatase 2C, putative [Ichthyophthirius multifiliis]|uniref:Protein phosphatase 2C, putative n=1 Tax=Ichthyophthirius multifiliis TaxID=5932 RepID=G0QLI9_ICHMU|nr:protein phosphatase 2C, putative [Ichthyophthirius multifiliis]EGR33915.1 protein phosphatase 2C, putative [Ichthyophthirius multifiliis]|eukprot:XP_004039219.1 protein phosphatase 2C, putative [Ichthyophthirius multifiliis]